MLGRVRIVLVSLFAILGAWLAAYGAPSVLDRLYMLVREYLVPEYSPGITQPIVVQREARPEGPPAVEEQIQPAPPVAEQVPTADPAPAAVSEPVADPSRAAVDRGSGLMPPEPQPQAADDTDIEGYPGARYPATIVAVALLGLIMGGAVGNRFCDLLERWLGLWDKMVTGDKVTLFVGVIAGILASVPFLFVLQGVGAIAAGIVALPIVVGITALSVYALRSMEDVLPWTNARGTGKRSGIKVLDTNVIIDGRIYDLMRTGFLDGQLYVPNFVLKELQYIADSSDVLRRQRGRRGLEILRLMQTEFEVEIGIHDRVVAGSDEEVDHRLVRLAKALGADLVSNDFNLNRVAGLQKVRVLSVNDLALALRPNVLPGETMDVAIIREGSQYGQGIGYLEDGTMVVVENGKAHINDTARVAVTQVIQTERGKMIFAEVDMPSDANDSYRHRKAAREHRTP